MQKSRFTALWQRCHPNGTSLDPAAVFRELVDHYSEAGRYYHTPEHIAHCLRQFDLASNHMNEPDAVEMAIWYHDVVYESTAKDNEQRSADLFDHHTGGSFPSDFKRTVHDLIMVTVHRELPKSWDQKFMVDIDLSSFGLPWEEFLRDSQAVRSECGHLPDDQFFPKQKCFLRSLLERQPFCLTEFFRERHEQSAKENIRRYLEQLDRQGL